jgi:competence protein ComGC
VKPVSVRNSRTTSSGIQVLEVGIPTAESPPFDYFGIGQWDWVRLMGLRRDKGFTIAEGLTILMVMGIVAAITVPAVVRKQSHHQYKSIVLQLSQIDAAKQEAAFANGWSNQKTVSLKHDLVPAYLPSVPEGPLGGSYSANTVGAEATYEGKTADEWKSACEKDPTSQACGL